VSIARFAKRVDASQPEIVEVLRKAATLVWIIGRPVDLLCLTGRTYWTAEVKAGRGKESEGQTEFHRLALMRGAPHFVLRTPDEALQVVMRLGVA
jgi:hypothetical protein